MRYSEKTFELDKLISSVRDSRKRAWISTKTFVYSALVMAMGQMGSLNALEQTRGRRYWLRFMGKGLPSADAIGDASQVMEGDSLRQMIRSVYSQLKRNKALRPAHGAKQFSLIVDGHEMHSSYLRECRGCLERTIHKSSGDEKQSYHRCVMATLLCEGIFLPLDMEPQRAGEDEVACAVRLLERVIRHYPRAFKLILADGLYAGAPFFQMAVEHGKDVIAVLKDERRDVLKDARGLFKGHRPQCYNEGNREIQCWDMENFTTWPQFGRPVRIVSTVERKRVRRQKTKKLNWEVSTWAWVSTIPKEELDTRIFVQTAHDRWQIENKGFNELVNYWHADHVYCHHPVAIESFWLITMLAYILFHAFINRNLKPEIRDKHTKKHFAAMITAELYPPAPP